MATSAAETQSDALRYPVGRFDYTGPYTSQQRTELIDTIASAPAHYRNAVEGLTQQQLDTPYRPGGWTVRQTIHHVVDSHINSYVRFRLALTEDEPTIKTYEEKAWAELPDAKGQQVETSLCLLECLHSRWVELLRSLSDEQWQRKLKNPESGVMSLDKMLGMYAWHCRHHVAHIRGLRERNFDR